jgi:SAM-dependent methyltransferase
MILVSRSNSLDACISVAVIHHLSTEQRRQRAVAELVRCVRPGGRVLVCVWAYEQVCTSPPAPLHQCRRVVNSLLRTCSYRSTYATNMQVRALSVFAQ